MVFAIDTIDKETWSDAAGDPYFRIRRHEQWINYITRDAVPFIREVTNQKNGWEGYPGIITFGCSLGATHALNLWLRFPDIFDLCEIPGHIDKCVGQGAWEQVESTRYLAKRLAELGVDSVWVDFWGSDVNHDWPWWHKQVAYFMPKLLY